MYNKTLGYNRFSRKIIWIKIGSTNRDPGVVVSYFLDAVENVGGMVATLATLLSYKLPDQSILGCLRIVCSDRGVENSKIAECQIAFRLLHTDTNAGSKSHRYVTSPRNSVSYLLF